MSDGREDEMRELAVNLEMQKAQMEKLLRQVDLIRSYLEENLRAKETMTRFKDCNDGAEMLIPIGANIFLFCRAGDRTKVVRGAGADIALESPMDEAIQKLDERTTELREAEANLGKMQVDLERKMADVSKKLQSAYAEARREGGQGRAG